MLGIHMNDSIWRGYLKTIFLGICSVEWAISSMDYTPLNFLISHNVLFMTKLFLEFGTFQLYILVIYDELHVWSITVFISIPDNCSSFVKVYFASNFFEYMVESVDILFKFILTPTKNSYIIGIGPSSNVYWSQEGK